MAWPGELVLDADFLEIDQLETAILAGLKTRLMDPALFEAFAREFLEEVNRQRMAVSAARAGVRGELDRVSRHIKRLVDAILEGADAKPLNSRLKELEPRGRATPPSSMLPRRRTCASLPTSRGSTGNGSRVLSRCCGIRSTVARRSS